MRGIRWVHPAGQEGVFVIGELKTDGGGYDWDNAQEFEGQDGIEGKGERNNGYEDECDLACRGHLGRLW